MSYPLWLIFFLFIPSAILWFFYFKLLRRYWKTFLYAIFFALVFSIPWDTFAVKNNIWFFPKEGIWEFILVLFP